MAVQILNNMPDAAVYRGDLPDFPVRAQKALRGSTRISGRALFMAATIGVHLVAGAAFLNVRQRERIEEVPEPIVATLMEASSAEAEPPREFTPPAVNVVYSLTVPQDLSFESDSAPEVITAAISPSTPQFTPPPMVESVEYVRAPAPVYPAESKRKRERGTCLLRVMVDANGRAAQIRVERSSGYERLDIAAREAVEKALFRPHEVNGIAQAAQVLIPIEFARRPS
ncbi:MAG TPA: energy transducer TonB [Steroidobacteraceae bacterium]|nr:energy transducer TonB [Steroidobacteraceae bacterium]